MSAAEVKEQKFRHYDLNKLGIRDALSKILPGYANRLEEILFNDIYGNITDEPERTLSSAYVTTHKNKVELELHSRGQEGSDKICAKFGFKIGKDEVSIFRQVPPDIWLPIRKVSSS